jgi:hypothetical protein
LWTIRGVHASIWNYADEDFKLSDFLVIKKITQSYTEKSQRFTEKDCKLCGSLCLLSGSLCNKLFCGVIKSYTELHGEVTEIHRERL